MAGSLNRAMIIGNVTRDPETRQIPSGQTVCSFGVATNRNWKDQAGNKQEAVEFHNIVAWGKLGEICGQYLAKGRKVYVDGRIQTRDWEGQDGVKRNRTEIVVENMVLLDRAPGGSSSPFGGSSAPQASYTSSTPPLKDDPGINPDDEIKIEDIPF
ncbi:MAG: single-stranded DNA-binding protein [Patescibacteria group bacterium]